MSEEPPKPPPPPSCASSSRSPPGSPPQHGDCTCTYRRAGPGPMPGPNCSSTRAGHQRPRGPDRRPQRARYRPAMEHTGSEAGPTTTPYREPRAATPIRPCTPRTSVDPGWARLMDRDREGRHEAPCQARRGPAVVTGRRERRRRAAPRLPRAGTGGNARQSHMTPRRGPARRRSRGLGPPGAPRRGDGARRRACG